MIGKNRLMTDIAQRQITDFLDNEIQLIKEGHTVEIVGRELKLEYVMNIEIDGVVRNIKFIGTADRIDRLDGILRVVDYKTGSVQDDDVVVKDGTVPDKWFQIMFYAWLYKRKYGVKEPFNACLAVLRSKSNPYKYAEDRRSDSRNVGMLSISDEMFDDFENLVVGIVSSMLSAETKRFCYPERKCDVCKYCNMSAFCKVE